MSNTIGHIETLSGEASIISANGESLPAAVNTAIGEDSLIQTGANGNVIIRFSDGSSMSVGPGQMVLVDKTVSDSEELAVDETQAEVDSLQAILAESPDLSVFEETAAGEAVAVGGSSLIVDSFEKHNDNSGDSGSSMLDQFASNKHDHGLDDDDTFGLITDNTAATVSLNNVLTNDNTPTITGTVSDPTADIVISVGGNDYTAINNGDGTWTLPATDPLPDGTTEIVVVATDPAGNETTETAEITVDTVDPIVTIDPVNTNDTTPVITGTTDDNTATIVVTIGGEEQTATNNGDGTWTLPITNPLPEGDNVVTVVATDPAGNSTTETETIIIDATAPTVTVDTTPTNDATPTIGGTISEDDATIVVTIGGTDYDAVNNGDGTWTLPVTDTLPEGDNEITVVATDPAGNESTEVVNLVIDLTAPIVNIDPIHTNDSSPEITGTVNDGEATVVVAINGTDYPAINNGDGTWTLPDDTVAELPENVDIEITVIATDTVGNETVITDTFVVDTLLDDDDNDNGGNVVTIDTITEDTGESNSDFITNDNTLIIRGTYDNEVENVLAIKIDGVSVDPADIIISNKQWELNLEDTPFGEGSHTIEAIVTDDAGNEKSITQNVVIDTSGTGDDGNGTGINGKDATVTLDEISDDYINLDETLSGITVTGETTLLNGGEVVVEFNGKSYTTTAAGGDVSGTPNTFSITIATEDLVGVNDGTYIVTATVIADKAGNTVSDTEDVTIDTSNSDNNGNGNTDSGADATITLHEISDNYINNAETTEDLVITGTSTAKEGSAVIIEITGGDGVPHNINEFLNPVTAADYDSSNDVIITVKSDGTFDVTFIATAFSLFPDGDYTVTATVIADNAGNTIFDEQNVLLDTTFTDDDGDFPQGGGNLITIDSITKDTGTFDDDFITSDNKLIISGSFDNETANRILSVTVDGVSYNVVTSIDTTDKSWSVDLTNVTLSDGDHTIIATIADEAGNTQTATQIVTIDTTPADADAIVLDEISNNYINAVEHDKVLTITGSVGSASVAGDAVSIDFNNITYNTIVVVDGNGDLRFSVDVPIVDVQALIDGTIYTATATTTTTTQTVTDTEDVTVDLTLIAIGNNGNLITVDGITEDTGTSNSDFITNDTTIIISGTYDNSADVHGIENVLTITINGQLYTPTLSGTDWTIDLTNTPLSDGDYELVATLSDAAGNTTTETQTITIDTTVNPTEGDATILLDEISGNVINADEASSSTLTVISGTTTAAQDEIVTIRVNGVVFTTTFVLANGTFSVEIPQGTFTQTDINGDLIFSDATYTVTAEVMADAAGNVTSDEQTVILDTTLGNTVDDTNSVSESALSIGTDPSATGRVAQGNLLDNDTLDSDVTITELNIGSETSTVVAEFPALLMLDTPNGIIYVATEATNVNGTDYVAGDYFYELQDASSDASETITYTVSDSVGNTTTSDLTITIEDDSADAQDIDTYLVDKVQGTSTNLTFVIDVSGSMDEVVEHTVTTTTYETVDISGFGNHDYTFSITGKVGDKVFIEDDGFFGGKDQIGVITNEDGTFSTTVSVGDGDYTVTAETINTRLDITKDAISDLIDSYLIKGDVNVKLVKFESGAQYSEWFTTSEIDQAKAQINALEADGGTNYNAAISTVESFYNTSSDPVPTASDSQLYFLSDGEPGGYNDELDGGDQTTWANFIDANNIDVHAIGVGIGASDSGPINELSTISNPNGTNPGNDPILVDDESALFQILLDTMTDGRISGNLLFSNDHSSPITLGADGGEITKLEMLDTNGNPIPGAFVSTSDLDVDGNVTMTTPLGAEVTINFYTGEYSYQLDVTSSNFGESESVRITAETTDGQIISSDFTLHIDLSNTDGSDIVLYDNASTFNDGGAGFDTLVLSENQNLDFDNISNIQNIEAIDLVGADHSITNLTAQDVIDMTDTNNELFIYGDSGDNVAMDATLTKTANTTVIDGKTFDIYADAGNTVTVNIEQEIIVS